MTFDDSLCLCLVHEGLPSLGSLTVETLPVLPCHGRDGQECRIIDHVRLSATKALGVFPKWGTLTPSKDIQTIAHLKMRKFMVLGYPIFYQKL
jgi:hypothetical protein